MRQFLSSICLLVTISFFLCLATACGFYQISPNFILVLDRSGFIHVVRIKAIECSALALFTLRLSNLGTVIKYSSPESPNLIEFKSGDTPDFLFLLVPTWDRTGDRQVQPHVGFNPASSCLSIKHVNFTFRIGDAMPGWHVCYNLQLQINLREKDVKFHIMVSFWNYVGIFITYFFHTMSCYLEVVILIIMYVFEQ